MPVVRATGVAVTGRGNTSRVGTPKLSSEIQKAMENAVLSCEQEGITDDAEIKRRMREARERVRTT